MIRPAREGEIGVFRERLQRLVRDRRGSSRCRRGHAGPTPAAGTSPGRTCAPCRRCLAARPRRAGEDGEPASAPTAGRDRRRRGRQPRANEERLGVQQDGCRQQTWPARSRRRVAPHQALGDLGDLELTHFFEPGECRGQITGAVTGQRGEIGGRQSRGGVLAGGRDNSRAATTTMARTAAAGQRSAKHGRL